MSIESAAARLGGVCPAGNGEFLAMPEAEIRAVEADAGAALPVSYRSLLARFGAFSFRGRSEDDPFVSFISKANLPSYITASGLAMFDYFYGVTREKGPSGLQKQILFFKGRIPETMIPIAGDGGAGQICLGIKCEDAGKVFYWDMADEPFDEESYLEEYDEPMPPDHKRRNVYLVAHSFDEFLDQLVLAPRDVHET